MSEQEERSTAKLDIPLPKGLEEWLKENKRHECSFVSELKAVEEELADAQRRETERDAELAAAVAAKNGAYTERNALVAALSKLFPASLERDGGEDEDWQWVAVIDFPTGQATWHLHMSELPNFDHLERDAGRAWDGHTTEEKYQRVAALSGAALLREHERRGAVVEAARKPCGPERDTAIAREIFAAITAERERQERLKVERGWKWSLSTPGVSNFERLMPLMEEVGEVAHAIRVAEGFAVAGNSHDNHGLRAELIQVAACAVAWLEALGAEDAALRAVRAEAKEKRA